MQRHTRQRAAIGQILEQQDRPLSPQEILVAATAMVPKLGIATVYRAIKALMAEGAITAVDLPGEPARYERATRKHHHHFHCRMCDHVFEVDSCPKGIRAVVPHGFTLETHDIVLYGRCDRCATRRGASAVSRTALASASR